MAQLLVPLLGVCHGSNIVPDNSSDRAFLVETAAGPVVCAQAGVRSRACLGVPFAAPPVGDLRWRPPAPVPSWRATVPRDATAQRPACIQGDRAPVPNRTDEDCLYLDIYTPRAPPSPGANATGYAVMVWLHGGSYSTGAPQNATGFVELAGDVVWVGVNYRLNVFGFLAGDPLRALSGGELVNSTGNYGLQDQRAALRWVRENIASFGGDPTRVTIDGCSAGAGSVACHLTNRRSWPYFDRAAGESGLFAAWNTNTMEKSAGLYAAVAAKARCPTTGPGSAACLLALPAATLAAAATAGFAACPGAHWGPTVDGVDTTASPRDAAADGELFRGPVLLGTARDETCSLAGRDWPFNLDLAGFERDTTARYGAIGINTSKVVALYGGQVRPSIVRARRPVSQWWWAAIERSSDFGFHCPTRWAADRLASVSGNPVWLFSYNVSFEMWAYYSGGLECCPHCSELSGLFFETPPDRTTAAGNLTAAIATYHASFVKHGDPNTARLAGSPAWPHYHPHGQLGGAATGASLALALPTYGGIRSEFGYRAVQCDFWDTLPGGPDESLRLRGRAHEG